MSQPDLRGFRLLNGKIVTTYPRLDEMGPEPAPFHPADGPDEPIGTRHDEAPE